MAMTLNAADTLLLLNVANQGVHLWDIRESLRQLLECATRNVCTILPRWNQIHLYSYT